MIDSGESKQAFAERLGQWLDCSDAIVLHAAHSATNPPAAQCAARPTAILAVGDELARVRTALVGSITKSCSPGDGETRLKWPTPSGGATIAASDSASAFAPYRRFYVAHQGDMEQRIGALRRSVQKTLARASATLRQLATLDAALDQVLGARERQLLALIPVLLEDRFEQLLAGHRQSLGDPAPADDPALWPGGWLERFGKELQAILLAELDLRLQPVTGLIEAFGNEAE